MSNLTKHIADLEKIEFESDKDVERYAKTAKRVAQELHLRIGMDADMLQATLGQYRGRWFDFGNIGPRTRARLVAGHLKVSAEAVRAFGTGAARMHGSFRKHFLEPEREARRRHEQAKRSRKFTISDDA